MEPGVPHGAGGAPWSWGGSAAPLPWPPLGSDPPHPSMGCPLSSKSLKGHSREQTPNRPQSLHQPPKSPVEHPKGCVTQPSVLEKGCALGCTVSEAALGKGLEVPQDCGWIQNECPEQD